MKVIGWTRQSKISEPIHKPQSDSLKVIAWKFAALRIPLLPLDCMVRDIPEAEQLLDTGIALESPNLRKALASGKLSAQRARLRYKLRSSTRSTPQGLWANVGWITTSDNTRVKVRTTTTLIAKESLGNKRALDLDTRFGSLVVSGLQPPYEQLLLMEPVQKDKVTIHLSGLLEGAPRMNWRSVSDPLPPDLQLARSERVLGRISVFEGGLSPKIFNEAAKISEVLLRCSPEGRSTLDPLRKWFSENFGERHAIKFSTLMERSDLLTFYEPQVKIPTNQRLAQFAIDALASKEPLDLGSGDVLEALTQAHSTEIQWPATAELFASVLSGVHAGSAGFALEVTPIGLSPWAGRAMGRFFQHTPNPINWEDYYSHTVESHGYKVVELCALPSDRQLWDLVPHRPILRECLWLRQDLLPEGAQSLRLQDLVVAYDYGRLSLMDGRSQQKVALVPMHMVSRAHMPLLISLLLDMSLDSFVQPRGFDWGSLEHSRRLPRIIFGNTVVSPAQWTVSVRELLSPYTRQQLGIPNSVAVKDYDRRLIVNLEDSSQTEAVFSKSSEALFTVQETFEKHPEVIGLHGRHSNEVVIPLELKRRGCVVDSFISFSLSHDPDWTWISIFIKPSLLGIEHILDHVLEILISATEPSQWFFLRYIDYLQEPEVRLRLGYPESQVPPLVAGWETLRRLATHGDIREFDIRPYRPEHGRWGVRNGNSVHRIFQIQSQAALLMRSQGSNLLGSYYRMAWQTAVTVLGYDQSLQWLGGKSLNEHIASYKSHKELLLDLLAERADHAYFSGMPSGIELVEDGVPLTRVTNTLWHLCFNRFLGINPTLERELLGGMQLAARALLKRNHWETR